LGNRTTLSRAPVPRGILPGSRSLKRRMLDYSSSLSATRLRCATARQGLRRRVPRRSPLGRRRAVSISFSLRELRLGKPAQPCLSEASEGCRADLSDVARRAKASQMPSSTSLMPSFWPARTWAGARAGRSGIARRIDHRLNNIIFLLRLRANGISRPME